MRLTQGTFSFLPDLSREEIVKQVEYCLAKGYSMNVEYTDDPHPRNPYWEMWNAPMFDTADSMAIVEQIEACRKAFPERYIKVNANDSTRGRETVALSFIVNRPAREPGFRLDRQEAAGRTVRYTIHSYATEKPEGSRYGNGSR